MGAPCSFLFSDCLDGQSNTAFAPANSFTEPKLLDGMLATVTAARLSRVGSRELKEAQGFGLRLDARLQHEINATCIAMLLVLAMFAL